MRALLFLWKRLWINYLKKALRKPTFYIYVVFIAFYVIMISISLQSMFVAPDSSMLAMILIGFSLLTIPGNLNSFAKRKGLLFRNSDIHFVFPSPIGPKTILVSTFLRTLVSRLLMCLILVAVGIFAFRIEVWRMLLYGLFSIGFQFTYEGCLAVILFASEKLGERGRKWIVGLSYGVYALLAVIVAVEYFRVGLGFQLATAFLESEALRLVPILGWYISVIMMIFIGPSVVTVIGCICYVVSFVLLLMTALRMQCTGEYYEDALKFADDYEEALQKQKKGKTVVAIGKKEKYGTAKITWKGSGARALFYRQLLEYKKTRFFIFDLMMLLHLAAGIIIGLVSIFDAEGFGEVTPFILPLVGCYIIFIFTSINGKWANELCSPYTYLIPDNTLQKLLCVTGIQNIKNLISALLLMVPGGILIGLSPVIIVLGTVAYTLFAATKLYGHTMTEVVVGDTLGRFGQQMLEMLLIGLGLGAACLSALLGMMVSGLTLAYVLMCLMLFLYDSILITVSTLNFYHMEKE